MDEITFIDWPSLNQASIAAPSASTMQRYGLIGVSGSGKHRSDRSVQLIDTVCLNGIYNMAPPHTSREAWLAAAAVHLAIDFSVAGYTMPKMRFAIGFRSTGRHGTTLGECWSDKHSRDGTHEIFIRADQSDPAEVLAILHHEIVHAVVGSEAKHGPVFKKCALAVGLQGPMRHTTPSPAVAARLATIAEGLGPLPHAALDWTDRKKQSTRLLKAQCHCEYTVRIARTWVERVGPPHCPLHGPMAVDGFTQGGGQ